MSKRAAITATTFAFRLPAPHVQSDRLSIYIPALGPMGVPSGMPGVPDRQHAGQREILDGVAPAYAPLRADAIRVTRRAAQRGRLKARMLLRRALVQ